MASRLLLRQSFAPVAAGAAVAGLAVFPWTTLHAESPNGPESKKAMYDDFEDIPSLPTSARHTSNTPAPPRRSSSRTPTDRLAVQIGKTRLFLYNHVAAAENKVNAVMDSVLDLEQSFTGTIASLAPSPRSGEKLLPGTLYVLVAAMAGSIVSRNRNIMLRAAVPLAVGVGAGWVVLPVTMRNISDLAWKYEQKFPVIADSHVRTRESIEKAWKMAKVHSQQAANIVDDKVSTGREAVEGWVKKGK